MPKPRVNVIAAPLSTIVAAVLLPVAGVLYLYITLIFDGCCGAGPDTSNDNWQGLAIIALVFATCSVIYGILHAGWKKR